MLFKDFQKGKSLAKTFTKLFQTCLKLQGQDMRSGFHASQKYLGNLANPPVISVLIVSGLANPDFPVKVEAIAFIPE